jgi:DNA polymerase-3 subunit beta
MKFAAPASALTAALAMTAPASVAIKKLTDRKPPPDVQVHIVAGGGNVSFTVTNPRAGVTISATTAAKVMLPGEAATSATRLNALLAAFSPGTIVEISGEKGGIRISSTNSTYCLPTLPDSPSAFAIKGEIGHIELPRADCLRLLEVLPAVATEKSRNYLCGLHLHNVEDQLVALATDGTTLLNIAVTADHFSDDERLIIPTPAATMLRRLLRQAKTDSVTLRRSRGLFAVTAPGSFELVTALVDGSYPDYRRIIPCAIGNSATCQRAELLGALARLQAVGSGLVRFSWEEGDTELLVSLLQQPGTGVDTLAAQTTGSASMAFDLAQLAPLITEFDNEAVHLDVTDRGLLIHQGDKTGVLASCRWQDTAKDAAA